MDLLHRMHFLWKLEAFFAIYANKAVTFTEGNIHLTMKMPLFTPLYATPNLSNDILIVEQSTIR